VFIKGTGILDNRSFEARGGIQRRDTTLSSD